MAPRTSNVNYGPGQTVANLAIVEVGADGQITISNTSAGSVQVVVDASAYFTMSGFYNAPGSYHPVVTTRLPANASAVVVNLTVTEPTSFGFITAYPLTSRSSCVENLQHFKTTH